MSHGQHLAPGLVVFTKRLLYMNGILREDTLLYELRTKQKPLFLFLHAQVLKDWLLPHVPKKVRAGEPDLYSMYVEERIGFLMSFVWCCQIGRFWIFWVCGLFDILVTPQSRYHHHAKRQSTQHHTGSNFHLKLTAREGWDSFRIVPDHVPT